MPTGTSAFLLITRVDLLRTLYHLTGGKGNDDALTEHDVSTLEQAYYYLQHGLWEAQEYLLDHGFADWWITTSAVLSFSGSDATGGRYVATPTDFLRLAGTTERSPLHRADGSRWGRLEPEERNLAERYGDVFAVRGQRVVLGKGAAPPTDLVLDYHAMHEDLAADNTAIDFPVKLRPLIPAYAARMASKDQWIPGGGEIEARIEGAVLRAEREAASQANRTDGQRVMRVRPAFGGRWMTG